MPVPKPAPGFILLASPLEKAIPMRFFDTVSVQEIAHRIPSGTKLCVAKDESGVSMVVTRELARQAREGALRDLHLITVPVSGIQADILIGAGAVGTLETSAVSLGEYGPAPCFTRAVKARAIRLIDGTCPAIYAGLQAGEKGIPFIPLRGIVESDLMRHRADWQVIDNPFSTMRDPVVLIEAIKPDIALFHAPFADRFGNVFVGRQREVATMAHAARETFVTVERIVDEDLAHHPQMAGSTIPAVYISAIAVAPRGAAPLQLGGEYGIAEAVLARYAKQAASQAGFEEWLQDWLSTVSAARSTTEAALSA